MGDESSVLADVDIFYTCCERTHYGLAFFFNSFINDGEIAPVEHYSLVARSYRLSVWAFSIFKFFLF